MSDVQEVKLYKNGFFGKTVKMFIYNKFILIVWSRKNLDLNLFFNKS